MKPRDSLSRTIALCLLLLACPLAAQTEEPEPAEPAAQPATAEQDPGSKDSEQPTPEAPAQAEDSPFDYQASEEISEDLSVSFPVDI